MTLYTRNSMLDGKLYSMEVNTTKEKLDNWEANKERLPLIQYYFPELSEDEREFVLTGINPEAWFRVFGEESDV